MPFAPAWRRSVFIGAREPCGYSYSGGTAGRTYLGPLSKVSDADRWRHPSAAIATTPASLISAARREKLSQSAAPPPFRHFGPLQGGLDALDEPGRGVGLFVEVSVCPANWRRPPPDRP